MERQGGGPGFLAGLVLGLALGLVLGLLFAPRPGRETREQLAEQGIELLPLSREELRARTEQLIARQRQRWAEASEAARQAAEQARAELRARYERAKRGEG